MLAIICFVTTFRTSNNFSSIPCMWTFAWEAVRFGQICSKLSFSLLMIHVRQRQSRRSNHSVLPGMMYPFLPFLRQCPEILQHWWRDWKIIKKFHQSEHWYNFLTTITTSIMASKCQWAAACTATTQDLQVVWKSTPWCAPGLGLHTKENKAPSFSQDSLVQ